MTESARKSTDKAQGYSNEGRSGPTRPDGHARSFTHYHSIFRAAAVGIARTDLDGLILDVNDRLCAMLGYQASALIGMTTRDLTCPEDRDRHDGLRVKLINGEIDQFSAEKRYLRKDGSAVWVLRSVTLARDAANEEPYLVQVMDDISERKQAQAQVERLRRARDVAAACHRALVHVAEETRMLEEICRTAVESGGYKQVWVGLTSSEDKRALTLAAHAGYDNGLPLPMTSPAVFTPDGHYCGKMADVVASGRPSIERDVIKEASDPAMRARAIAHGWGSSLSLPLVAEGRIVGGIEFNAREPDAFDADEIALLSGLASDVAFGISARRAKAAHERTERQLREHEQRFQATFEQAAVGITHASLSGDFISVNRKFCAILGYREEELLSRPCREFTHPEDRGRDLHDRELMLQGASTHYSRENRFLGKNGKVVWTYRTVSLARDANGTPQHFIAVVEDITERKELERRFRETFDQAAVGIVHTTLDGKYLQVNRRFCEMLGYDEAELIGTRAAELTHREDVDKSAAARRLMLDGKLAHVSEEKRYVRKDGSILWTNRTVSLARDASGQPMYFIRVIEDISAHKLSAQRRDMEHAVTGLLAESPTLEVAMPRLIRVICESLGWACGMYWRWDRREQLLRCADSWCVDRQPVTGFVSASRNTVNEAPGWQGKAPGIHSDGMVRGVWLSGAPVWFPDVIKRPGFRRSAIAALAGLHTAFGFPILAGDRPLGVMEFYSSAIEQPDEALLRSVQAIGRQLGQFIQRKLAEDAQRASEERYRDMFDASPLPMWVWDDETLDIITVNQAAIDHYGFSRNEFERMSIRDLWPEAERKRCEENIGDRSGKNTLYVQSTHVTKDARVIAVEVTARAFAMDARPAWLTLINDVTERLRVEEKLLHLAHYDTLTGLPNRVLFYDRLKQALALAKRNGWITGVLFMDVDRFKNVNDTLGHSTGDHLLQLVSERLLGSVRASDTVGRLGGDEFGIVLSNLGDAGSAGVVAQQIIENFKLPFKLESSEVYVTPSIGITLCPKDGTGQDELIKNADAAMYRAKEAGRNNFQYYSPEMSVRGAALLSLETRLRRALENEEFLLHFQPKATIATGQLSGVEALLRWNRPDAGLVSPAEFIPVLEETGLIVQTGEWVLNAVCEQINAWLAAGIKPVPIAVNLSARQFLSPDLGPSIRRVLEAHRVAPALIELEITESSLMTNPQEAARTLEYLRTLGVALSVDDFGTGYSSLSYLKRFPLNALKVDRSFVRDITSDANDAAITAAVISMAHSLGLKVVAEGVETEEQLSFLARHGCDQIQGYYLAKPVSAAECTRIILDDRRLQIPPLTSQMA